MEATAVSLARSVLDGVLNRAGSAVADEAALLLGVRREVEFIRDELDMMRSFLKVATANPDADDTVRTWVKQVRDLAYDVEDSLLDFALFADTLSSSSSSSWWLPWRIAERHRVAARIRELKASVEELNQRFLRYRIVVEHPRVARRRRLRRPAAASRPRWAVLLGGAGVPGVGHHRAGEGEGGGDGARPLRLRRRRRRRRRRAGGGVGVGMGGMGKSSLVRMVYNDPELLDAFDCDAWVTVPHPLDSADEFVRRLRRHLAVGKDQDVHAYLREKRYVIIVDDLHSREEWEHIWPVLHVDGGKGSRVVVTTRREDVARHCAGLVREGHGHVYELRPLGREESKDLFCQKVYKSTEYILEKEMEDLAGPIFKRDAGGFHWPYPL
ncbi:hypothetical protein EE612_048960 [Oryza sativa]|nr:hypothetical protein EE612_048960 [Oryza sativa]